MRFIARFAQEQEEYFEVITVYDLKTVKERINKRTPTILSIEKEYPAVIWFERKMLDDFGIKTLYGTTSPPLLYHKTIYFGTYPMRKNYTQKHLLFRDKAFKHFKKIEKVSLGPTQSYHLESSQFKFIADHHQITHFEIKTFYKHRGIEKMLEGLTLNEARPIVERISGSMSIAYQLAFLDIELQASKKELPMVIKKRHIFFLEFERVLNHLSDMAILCQFSDFKEGAFFLMKLQEEGRVILKELTGHRYGFSAIRIHDDISSIQEGYDYVLSLEKELFWFEEWINNKRKFWGNLSKIGILSKEDTKRYGLVGIMARSVNIPLDRRKEDVYYEACNFSPLMESKGDIKARFKVRLNEIYQAINLIRPLINNRVLPFFLGTLEEGEYTSYVESSSGELMMYLCIKDERIERFFLRDPSFLNEQILSSIMNNNPISSLGLILKSIPLNFSASDL